jgi:hypothetical protein
VEGRYASSQQRRRKPMATPGDPDPNIAKPSRKWQGKSGGSLSKSVSRPNLGEYRKSDNEYLM